VGTGNRRLMRNMPEFIARQERRLTTLSCARVKRVSGVRKEGRNFEKVFGKKCQLGKKVGRIGRKKNGSPKLLNLGNCPPGKRVFSGIQQGVSFTSGPRD